MNEEIQRLEQISDFYAAGDFMDNLLVDREVQLIEKMRRSNKNALGDAAVRAFYALGEDVPQYCANIFAVAEKRKLT